MVSKTENPYASPGLDHPLNSAEPRGASPPLSRWLGRSTFNGTLFGFTWIGITAFITFCFATTSGGDSWITELVLAPNGTLTASGAQVFCQLFLVAITVGGAMGNLCGILHGYIVHCLARDHRHYRPLMGGAAVVLGLLVIALPFSAFCLLAVGLSVMWRSVAGVISVGVALAYAWRATRLADKCVFSSADLSSEASR